MKTFQPANGSRLVTGHKIVFVLKATEEENVRLPEGLEEYRDCLLYAFSPDMNIFELMKMEPDMIIISRNGHVIERNNWQHHN